MPPAAKPRVGGHAVNRNSDTAFDVHATAVFFNLGAVAGLVPTGLPGSGFASCVLRPDRHRPVDRRVGVRPYGSRPRPTAAPGAESRRV